ncbi:hypothetical protein H6G25_02350 [Dolichospermum sp. FACHB-1091]|uniref:lectin-like protein n=1 Tax=Dolichospermum sp. FACHB-1091 TaxID=2692798 RepID=UPI00167FFF85|nr:lectin-like protein [Dolichospermum sp. FACHB-1091]MBD2442062.1 hypothetical protein [Dolichospermum sp. FACHB-1091]
MARFTVTNNNDSGAGSLRQAIIDAGNAVGVDIIDLTSVSGTINLNSSLGNLNTGNDINFVDDGNTTISGQNAYQILAVNGASVTFSRLTFANGLARGGDGNGGGGGGLGAGGALFINAGNVTLNNITFTGNRAVGGNANSNAGRGGHGGEYYGRNRNGDNGQAGGGGGGLNGGSASSGGVGGNTVEGGAGGAGAAGAAGSFGVGGGGGGGGAGGDHNGGAWSWNGGVGGAGGAGGFGAGGGGGGGGGGAGGKWSDKYQGSGGSAGTAGQFGGNGAGGAGGKRGEWYGDTSGVAGANGGQGGGGAGLGGAIFVNSGANLTLLNSVFTGNLATGGTGANNGQALGANIFVNGGTVQSIGTTATIARDYTNVNYTNNGTINAVSFPTNPNLYEYNGSIYRHTTAGTWQQAQAQAQSLGGNLVTVNNQAEQDWLVNTFGPTERLWIGLTDEETAGQYKWASGETSIYLNWAGNEPSDSAGHVQDYVYINYLSPGQWDDLGTGQLRGIIENKFYEYNGSKYLLTGPGTWKQAQDQAQSLGGNLVTVNNQAEQDWLVSTFGGSELLWIGLTDEVTEDQFRWASGETYTYTNTNWNWNTGEPNNLGNEDYAGMNWGGAGKWNDYPSTWSQRGIIEINHYGAVGGNPQSQFFSLAKPEKLTISVIGGFGPDIFQLRSYDGLTTSQQVSGGQGGDIFNISLEGSSGIVGLDFNAGKLKDLATTIVTPNWDIKNERRIANMAHASIQAGIDIASGVAQGINITGIGNGLISAAAAAAKGANTIANIAANYFLDIKETNAKLNQLGNFFDGQGANGWGTVNITQSRSLVEILDFEPGIDTITLPKLTGNQNYTFTLAAGSQNAVLVALYDGTNASIPFLKINIASNLQGLVNGQNIGLAQFIQSLLVSKSESANSVIGKTLSVIGKTLNDSSEVAVSGAIYTGTIAGDYIYVDKNNPTVGSVKIYGNAGDDILAGGGNNGSNEIYGGDGDDFIVPGGVNDTIDGGTGYDQVNYSLNAVGISITSSNSTNFKTVESVTGTVYNDTINYSDLQVAPDDGLPINLEGRAGNDNLIGSQYQDVIDGEDGNDTLIGGAGSDILKGGAGDDILNPGYSQYSTDTVDGGDGNDLLQVDYSNKTSASVGIHLGFQNNNVIYHRSGTNDNYELVKFSNIERFDIIGTQYDDAFEGRSGNDTFNGGAGNDFLDGGDGNDILDGGAGTDTQIGGLGNDIYVVDSTTDIITENANEGTDTIQSSVTLTLATNVENLTLTGTAAINGTGNAGNNVITGNSANNILDGGAGNDTLNGEDGNDLLYGDVASYGGSTLFNYNGNTYLLTTAGTWQQTQAQAQSLGGNLVTVNNQAEQDWLVSTFGGSELLWIGFTDEVTEGQFRWVSGETSTYTNWSPGEPNDANGGEDYVGMNWGGAGKWNDFGSASFRSIIEIVGANDILNGGAGNDTLNGGAGTDTLIGGLGDDIYIVDSTTEIITENANEGTDTIQSSVTLTLATNVENLTLTGTAVINGTGNAGNNVITGNSANNILDGGAGNDTLNGEDGNDLLYGDVASYGGSTLFNYNGNTYLLTTAGTWQQTQAQAQSLGGNLVTVNSQAEQDWLVSTFGGSELLWIGFTDEVTEGQFRWASGETSTYTNWSPGEPNDANGVEDYVHMYSNGKWNDSGSTAILRGIVEIVNANDILNGGAGNDTLDGGAGIDTLIGGLGNDIYVVDSTTDTITENVNEGTDTIQSSVTLTLATNVENLTLTGTAAINGTGNELNNVITGNTANNILDGGAGNDTLIGGLGNDIYVVDSTTDTITENANAGIDTIQSSVTYTILAANVENLTLTGTAAINGTGNAGNNVITGNSANNILDGGAGNDTLIGGLGNDIYVVDSTTDTITENANEGTDTIQSSVTYSILAANVENLTLTGTAVINGTGNELNNVITGNAANNILDGGAGNDTLNGGSRDSLLSLDGVNDYVNLNNPSHLNFTGEITIEAWVKVKATDGLRDIVAHDDSYNPFSAVFLRLWNGQYQIGSWNGTDYMATFVIPSADIGNWVHLAGVYDSQAQAWNLYRNGVLVNSTASSVGALQVNENWTIGAKGNGAERFFNGDIDEVRIWNKARTQQEIQANLNQTLTGNEANLAGYWNFDNVAGSTITDLAKGNNGTLTNGASIIVASDILIGGTGDDTYIVDSTTDTITENANEGTDTIQSSVTLTLATNVENLTLTGTAAINGTGNELNNVITGNSANNILDGGAGTDTLIGGLGNDIYVVDSTTDIITENANEGTDTIQSSVTLTLATNVENLTLTGTAAINGTGNELNNVITGNTANNILDGGAGNDTLIGGLGNDIYVVDSTTDTITENASGGTDTIQSSVTYTIATLALANVENLTLTGTAAINGTGNAGNNVITGNGANNTLNGGAGTDTLIGGLGNDIYVVDSTTDTITENASGGTDTIQSSVTYTIATLANVENLTLTGTAAINGTGNAGNNVITGNGANNILNGGAGTDTLIGGLGNDIYVVDSTTDTITENASGGTDTIQSSVTYTIATVTNVENLTLTGTAAANGTGNAGNNVITGNGANNILNGGAGNDILTGGFGKDTLTGGLGADRFDYRTLADSVFSNFDVITDFNANTGNDLFLVSTARSVFNNVTTPVATLDATGIAARLTNATFTANSAAQFTFGTRTFVAINDATAGFSATTDAIIEVTGLTGTLGISNFTTTLV